MHYVFLHVTMKPSALIVFLCVAYEIRGDCVWYGQCQGSGFKVRNCVYPGPPKPFAEDERAAALDILRNRCQGFLDKYPGERFCCDLNMLRSMEMGMNLAKGVFGRCPTCTFNLFQHICEFTCSPNQSLFLNPVKTEENNRGEYIVEIDMYFSDNYVRSTFDSCKDIVMPSTGEKAMTLACNNDPHCTAEKWFYCMGDASLPMVPFQINYVAPDNSSSHLPMALDTLRCNESYEGSLPCSCTDCEASCYVEFRDPSRDCCTLQIDFFAYLTLALLAIFTFITAAFCCWKWKNRESEEATYLEKVGDRIHSSLETFFAKWGTKCARHPSVVLAVSGFIVSSLAHGMPHLKVTTEPDEIWASPSSRSRMEKDYFESRFSPFYRTNQIFIKTKNLSSFNWTLPGSPEPTLLGPIFHDAFLREVHRLQMKIQDMVVEEGERLEKICFAPMRNNYTKEHTVEQCTVQSLWGYLQNDLGILDDRNRTLEKLVGCLSNNYKPECLAPYGGPIFSPLAVVGFEVEEDGQGGRRHNYLSATGLSLTFLLNNHVDKKKLEPALKWELKFIELMKNWTRTEMPEFVEVAFSSERSIQDEIERVSDAEMLTMLISYFIMFLYIAVALGRFEGISSALSHSRILLSVGGIIIVIASVVASLGFFGFVGIPTTLLTIEVVPFLVLAIGVDNIFLLVQTVDRLPRKEGETIAEHIGRALGQFGPSMLLTSASEATCFIIGSTSQMPAVKTFAMYSSVAVIFNFALQTTVFVSWLAIDLNRIQGRRLDILCCVKTGKKSNSLGENSGFLPSLFRDHYGPFLMKTPVRLAVVALFACWFAASICFSTKIELGLDQELSMPEDSYLNDYFESLKNLMEMGPPVFFVVKSGLNYSNPRHVNAVCGTVGCDSDSFVSSLTYASKSTDLTYLIKSPSSWIDDYFTWLGEAEQCCTMHPNRTYCSAEVHGDCEPCDVTMNQTIQRPTVEDFNHFLPFFLTENPTELCPKAGGAAYSGALSFGEDENGERTVTDSYFMSYHSTLRTSRDYYMALERARNVAENLGENLSEKLGMAVEVFPYSVFYVFYEQYLTLVNETLFSLSMTLVNVFVATFVLSGFDYISSLLVLLMSISAVVDLMGLMYLWGINLNAISLVNLIVSVGIGIEFCSHLVHSFSTSIMHDKISRATYAIGTTGSSVFSGITLTKLLGIVVLAFARSQIFRVFYFRMYFGMVIFGAAHGLVLLPVLLSYLGPRHNKCRVERLGTFLET